MEINNQHPAEKIYTAAHLKSICQRYGIADEIALKLKAASFIFPFKTNDYILDELIDWSRVPDDPVFKCTFPQFGMLEEPDGLRIVNAIVNQYPTVELAQLISAIRESYISPASRANTVGVPLCNGRLLTGLMDLMPGSLLLFPKPATDCYSYCSYCFRWTCKADRFVSFSYDDPQLPVTYLQEHPGISNVVFSGGDPLTMSTDTIKRFTDPLLPIKNLRSICFTTRSLVAYPYRFVLDDDASDLINYFTDIRKNGKHVSIIAHISHPRELMTKTVLRAVSVLTSAGIIIRCQNPLLRSVNDSPNTLAELWQREIALGMIPYNLFIESDDIKRPYFKISFERVLAIFKEAQGLVSGLAKTVQGPIFMHEGKKIVLIDILSLYGKKMFMFKNIEDPCESRINQPYFAEFDPNVVHMNQLKFVPTG